MRALPLAGMLLVLCCDIGYAQKNLGSDPDEGGIGGTGHGFDTIQKPELIERPEMPERIERVETIERIEPPDFDLSHPAGTGIDEVNIDPPSVEQR